ncbi:Gmad2 immunoglobulin-like domain-containing protein [Terrabacter sp. NPDC080008]|uniref:Gmad2 immunoglobulin-like domain-containing protein n=1 Tax=Terrabacter sp. NPDC080008 TaxID=3155176 RepID=UPI00344EFE4F
MNTDATGPAPRPGEDHGEPPTTAGAPGPRGDHPPLGSTEARLRRALHEEARSMAPTERLDAILTEARGTRASTAFTARGRGGDTARPTRSRRLMLPAAAAAAALLVAGTLWALNRPPAQAPPVAATSPTATSVAPTAPGTPSGASSGAPSSIPTTSAEGLSPSPTAAPTSAPGQATVRTTVPVYYVGPVVAGSPQLRLFREFAPASFPSPSTGDNTALAALRLAMGPAPAGSSYRSAWVGITPQSVAVSADGITVRLSGGTASTQQLAIEQLVWTVQAALGKSLPVRFQLADGGSQVSPGHPVTASYTRPSDPMAVLDQVAPIWVDEPARGAVVSAGKPVTVKGVASTFEATVLWELFRNGRRVDGGVTTAAQSAPARAAYTFTTKPVPAGTYVLRVYESSAEDASTVAEQRVPLTAR